MPINIHTLIAFLIGLCAAFLIVEIRGLHARMEKLEKNQPKRMPFKSQDEILDAMALLDVLQYKKHVDDEIESAKKKHEDQLIQELKERLARSLTVGTKRELSTKEKGDLL